MNRRSAATSVKAMHARLERRRKNGLWPYACPDLDQGASDAHMVYPEEVPLPEIPFSQPARV